MNARRHKVLYVITKSNWGGAQRSVYDLATNLPRDTFEPIVACGGNGELVVRLRAVGVRTINIKSLERDISLAKEVRAFFELMAVMRRERPDIVHLNSSKAGGLGALAARFARVPRVIFTVHGWAWNEPRPRWQRAGIRVAHWITALLSTAVITVSEYDASQGRRMPFVGGKVRMIHNGIAPAPLLLQAEARTRLGIPASATTVIGTIAELHRNKGLADGVRAIATLGDHRIVWCIIGGGEERSSLARQIGDLPIILAGKHENAAELLSAFDLFLLPSVKEGLPYVLLEAGAAGLPAIATRVGGIPEIVEDQVSGILVPPHCPETITSALAKLIADRARAKKMGETLQRAIAEKFSLERMVRETSAVYSQ